MRFDGFIEGDKLSRGDVDVIVTDGFSGNIALKSLEGTARFVTDLLRRAFTSSVRSKIGFLISRPATELLRHHLDPNNHNGAVFLGLNGLVVKSHGSATDKGVANAIRVAARMVREDLTRKITEDLANVSARHAPSWPRRNEPPRRSSSAPARRCRRAGSPTPSWPSGSTPPTNGSSSGPASSARHIAGDGETTATLATEAARKALAAAGIDADRDRPDRARHRDARPDLPGQRDPGPDRARHRRLHRLRRRRRSAPASSTRSRSPTIC